MLLATLSKIWTPYLGALIKAGLGAERPGTGLMTVPIVKTGNTLPHVLTRQINFESSVEWAPLFTKKKKIVFSLDWVLPIQLS